VHQILIVAMQFMTLATLTIFVLTPILVIYIGVEEVIYHRGKIDGELIAMNATLVFPMLAVIYLLRNIARTSLRPSNRNTKQIAYYCILVLVWAGTFLAFDGLSYRENDLAYSNRSTRSLPLQFALTSCNIVIIMVATLWISGKTIPSVFRIAAFALVCFCFIAGGGRGLFVQLILTTWLGIQFLKFASEPNIANQYKNNINLFTPKALLTAILTAAFIGFWGAIRDQQDDTFFAILYRASEPYWHHAYIRYLEYGSDMSTILDSLYRILSIPGRWIGIAYDSSIDGAEKILEDKLDIPFVKGVSLPITYFGEGFLMGGHLGALIYQSLTILFVVGSFYMINRLDFLDKYTKSAALAYQVNKCAFLYGKSLSGVVLVMYYETFRDMAAVIFITLAARKTYELLHPR